MKTLSLISAGFVVLSLAACSSNSSNGQALDTSNNTATTETNATDTSATVDIDDENGESTTNEVTTSEDGVSNGPDGENIDVNGVNGADTPAGQNDGQDSVMGTTSINPDSNLGQFQSSIKMLVGQSLLTLNQSLSMGELLSLQQETCLGAFDPALGQPLLAIDCDQPLAVSNVPIYAGIASFNNTPDCIASVQNNNTTNCTVAKARLTVNTLWIIPPTEAGQPERPQPKAGAFIEYAIDQNRLVVENLPAALAGRFRCEYDLTTGDQVQNTAGADCETQLNRLNGLIVEHLAAAS